jgi:hypothetical protein
MNNICGNVKPWLLRAVLLLSVSACGSMRPVTGAEGDTSRESEPPPAWQSGIQFHFADSTWATARELRYGARVEFFDGTGHRVVTGRDLWQNDGPVHTAWHRLWLPASGELPVSLRITIGDPAGGQTVAEYPVVAKRDQFHRIYFGVYTRREEPHRPSVLHDLRSFGVTRAARREPGDSLWIGYYVTGRDCFDCPL